MQDCRFAPPRCAFSAFRVPSEGALALVLTRWAEASQVGLLHVTELERSVGERATMARGFAPDFEVIALPAWDSLPYDRALPSRAVTGSRVAGLARLSEAAGRPFLLITSAAALLQRVPPPARLIERRITLAKGDPVALDWLQATLDAFGYRVEEQVDEPGEAAFRGATVDIFPAGAASPVRLDLRDGRIYVLHEFDPLDQRSVRTLDRLVLVPATEGFAVPGEAVAGVAERLLPDRERATLFDYLPGAGLVLERGVEQRLSDWLETIADGFEARRLTAPDKTLEAPAQVFLTREEVESEWERRSVITLTSDGCAISGIEQIEGEPARTLRALGNLAAARADVGDAVVICASDVGTLTHRLRKFSPIPLGTWADTRSLEPGRLGVLPPPLTQGFRLLPRLSVLAGEPALPRSRGTQAALTPDPLRIGDLAVEPEHGLARLTALEMVEDEHAATECVVLEFAAGQRHLVPAANAGSVWRYGSADACAAPDRLPGDTWRHRRDEVEAEIANTACGLAERQASRARQGAPVIDPPRGGMTLFRARVPFAMTEDQEDAIGAMLADMACARPMERLVRGDVGFGKTEVALHGAAASVMAGYQVAIAAPTTLLARQHLETFRRRLGPLGVEVAPLIGTSRRGEARALLARLKGSDPIVVVGTHALASASVRFARLGLLVIDEEQRFGEKHKAALHRLREGLHALTVTATPLPRSLQAGMAGLFEVSLLATPPVARQPVRTGVLEFHGALVRAALLREARRGGQSFLVCPRIKDLGPMRLRLQELVPELRVAEAHGKLRGNALDEVMLDFAGGLTDVLLATGIIEAGLDIPNANTMLVWRPDRFGLAQLHQLRGRVGRGRVRATALY